MLKLSQAQYRVLEADTMTRWRERLMAWLREHADEAGDKISAVAVAIGEVEPELVSQDWTGKIPKDLAQLPCAPVAWIVQFTNDRG